MVVSKSKTFPLIFSIIFINIIISSANFYYDFTSSSLQDNFKSLLRGLGIQQEDSKTNLYVPPLKCDDKQINNTPFPFKPGMYIGGEYSVPGWVDTRWEYRKNITIDYTRIAMNLNNFPVYIELYDEDLQNNAQASGNDIIFTDAQTGKVLAHEIEYYDRVYNSTHAKLVAWIKANVTSSAPGTTISLYYGNPSSPSHENPTAVWDSNYVFVLHMDEDPSSSDILDSTINGFDFEVEASSDMESEDLVIDHLGKAISFDGSNDYIYLPSAENFIGPTDKFTFECWLMLPNGGPLETTYLAAPGTSSNNPRLSFSSSSTFDFRIQTTSEDELDSTQSSFIANIWYHLTAVWDGTGAGLHQIYINGGLDNEDSTPRLGTHITWNTFAIGAEDDYTNGIGGDNPHNEIEAYISEFRLSDSVRSAAWIDAQYSNQQNPNSFLSISSQEERLNDWLLPLYKYRKNIQLNSSQITGTLVNYPLFINITDIDLTDTNKVQADGDDIAFATAEGWIWSDELVTNGGFELGSFAGWTTSGNWAYGTDPPQGNKGPQAGSYCAYISASSQATDYIYQDVNVEGYSSYIDTGKAILNASTWMVSAESGADLCSISIEFLNNEKNQITTPLIYNDLLLTQWTEFAVISELIPVNTRFIRIKASCFEDGWDAGSLDSVSVKIGTFQTASHGFKLNYDLLEFNLASGYLSAWVNVPRISDEEELNITLYYGNNALHSSEIPSDVWDSDFSGIWHMDEESGSGSYILDSSGNGYNGDPYGTTFSQMGVVQGARYLTGTGENYIEMDSGSELLNGWNEFTISFWLYPDYSSDAEWYNAGQGLVFYKAQSASLARIWRASWGGVFQVDITFDDYGTTYLQADINRAQWNFIVYSYDGDYLRVYVNGQFEASIHVGTDRLVFDSSQFAIGDYNDAFKGYIDEFQILKTGKSYSWVQTEYMNIINSIESFTLDNEEQNSKWWADASFAYRRDISIDHNKVIAALTNYTLLFDHTSTSYKMGTIASDASDILFFDEYQNKLPYEIDYFEQSLSQGRIIAWVRIPSVSSLVDTAFSLYYGSMESLESQENAIRTWDMYSGVWHLGEDPEDASPQFNDSTGNSNDGTANSLSSSHQVSGLIDGSLQFDDSNERHVSISDDSSLQLSTNIVLSAWVKTTDSDSDTGVIAAKWGELTSERNYWLGKLDASTIGFYVDSTQFVTTNLNLINNDIWHHVVGVADVVNGKIYIYVDGILRNSANYDGSSVTGTSNLHIGNSPGIIGQEWKGLIDEVRVGDFIPTLARLKAFYNNQMFPNTFVSVSTEKEFDITPPELVDFGVDDPGTGTGIFWASITDNLAGVNSVTIKINTTNYQMNNNGTHWIYQKTVNYLDYWTYQILNASDNVGNYITTSSATKDYSFSEDKVAPDVINWKYITNQNRFNANVSDSWGDIDTVIVTVTYHSSSLPDPNTAVMQLYNDFGNGLFGFFNDTLVMSNGDIEFKIWVNDTAGNSFLSTSHPGVVFINHAPIVSNINIATAPYYSNTPLVLSYNYYDEDGHAEAGTEIRWYKDNGTGFTLAKSYNDTKTIPASALYKNDDWYVTVRPSDGQIFGDLETSSTIIISNTPPTVISAQLLPLTAYTTSTLTISYTTFDYDGDPITQYYIEWFIDSIHNPAFDNQFSILSSSTLKEESWFYRLRAFDGSDNSSWKTSNTIIIRNTIPQAVNLNITPGTVYTTSTLTANWDIYDVDGDEENKDLAIIYWYKYGILQPSLTNLTTVNPGNTSKGELWSFKIKIWDGTNYSVLTELSSPISISNSLPNVNDPQVVTMNPKTGDNLAIDYQYSDDDNDVEGAPLIKWYLDDEYQSSYDNLDELPSSATTKGDYWHFQIQVYDGQGYSTPLNSSPILIENTAPEVSTLTLTSNPTTLDQLEASWQVTDADSFDTISFNITWYLEGEKNSSWLTSEFSAFLNPSNTSKGQLWTFTIEGSDGEASSGIVSFGTGVTIFNSLPIVSNPTFSDLNPGDSTDFSVIYGFSDADDDSEVQAEVVIYWYINWGYQPDYQNNRIIYGDNTTSGQVWYYIIRVSDGEGLSQNYTSVQGVTIGGGSNDAPQALNPTLTPLTPNTTQELTANYIYDDPESDPEVAFEIRWYKNNILQSLYNNLKTIPISATTKGDAWNFTIKVFDGISWSLLNSSNIIMIINSNPVVTDLSLTPQACTDDNLIASWDGSDVDSMDSLIFNITWYLNGQKNNTWITTENNAIINSLNTSKHQNWTFTIQAFDGTADSILVSLGYNISISNTAPTAYNIAITSSPKSTDDLTANWNFADLDGDTQIVSGAIITWYRNGENQTALFNKNIIEAGNTSKNEVWWFTVRVFDGEDHSNLAYESSHVVILNSEPLFSGFPLPIPTNPTRETGISIDLDDLLLSFIDPDGDDIEIVQICWYKNNVLMINLNDSFFIDGSHLLKGETWNYTVIVTDGLSTSNLETSEAFLVNNAPPVIENAYFEVTSDIHTIDDLVIIYQASDADDDAISVTGVHWYWFNDSSFDWEYNNTYDDLLVLPSSATTKGDRWQYEIQVTDGNLFSSWTESTIDVDIENSQPTIIISSIIISGGENTSDFLQVFYSWLDNDPEDEEGSTEIIWESATNYITNESDILPSKYTIAGERWWVTIRPHDGEEFGEPYNSKQFGLTVIIGNSAPEVIENEATVIGRFNGSDLPATTVGTVFDLIVKYNATDIDGEEGAIAYGLVLIEGGYVSGSKYHWFLNRSGVVSQVTSLNDLTTVPYYLTRRGDTWWCEIQPRDFFGDFGFPYNSSKIHIGNTAPIIVDVTWINASPTAKDNISFDLEYFDWDNDPYVSSLTLIQWFKNGVLISGTENCTILYNTYFVKNDNITVLIQPFDGTNWAESVFISDILHIRNSAPYAADITLQPSIYYDTEVLLLNWIYHDYDIDPQSALWSIKWIKNGILQESFENERFISLSNVRNNDLWRVEFRIYDGTDYSILYIQEIITKEIELVYQFDDSAMVDPDIRTSEFYVEDENLSIAYQFSRLGDAINSKLQWFKILSNGSVIELTAFTNQSSIPYWYTSPGETYYCTCTPYDGMYYWRTMNSSFVIIESRPIIGTAPNAIVLPLNDTEGHYLFNITVIDFQNPIEIVEFSLNDTLNISRYAEKDSTTNNWIFDYSLNPTLFGQLQNSFIIVTVRTSTFVNYNGHEFEIYTILTFNFTITDIAAPRVLEAYFIPNMEVNPTNLTFYAEVEEYGNEIGNVILHYYFELANTSAEGGIIGIGSEFLQAHNSIPMILLNESADVSLYSITVPFSGNSTNWNVFYWIETADTVGNVNYRAFDVQRDDPESIIRNSIVYSPPGLPEWVLSVAILVIFVIFIGAVVYVRFIRKPELVGLDKELVLKSLPQFLGGEYLTTLDNHTLGAIISFFDQRHGPIPIVVNPEMLKDNFNKLVELSDRSFSGTGFSPNFDIETSSSYDFVIGDSIIAVMSFGFALEKQEARGGQENVTFNLLIHKDLFKLVNQFLDDIQAKVHKLHEMMKDSSKTKDQLHKEVMSIRRFISAIILSYEAIYGTTDLMDSEE